jgi:hypothetical protein
MLVDNNYITKCAYAVTVYNGNVVIYSYNNQSLTTNPTYGLWANGGGVIAKGSTQPTGATANEYTSNGGVIR